MSWIGALSCGELEIPLIKSLCLAVFSLASIIACTVESDTSKTADAPKTSEKTEEVNACQPIQSLTCKSWPEQAQMTAKVTAVKALTSGSQKLCDVTIEPTSWSEHILCPMGETPSNFTYQVCGECPEKGSDVSGVLMGNGNGLRVLDK